MKQINTIDRFEILINQIENLTLINFTIQLQFGILQITVNQNKNILFYFNMHIKFSVQTLI